MKPTPLHQVVEAATVMTSGSISDAGFEERMAFCKECPSMHQIGQKMYCKACKCPRWKKAELHTKLRYKKHTCPKGNW